MAILNFWPFRKKVIDPPENSLGEFEDLREKNKTDDGLTIPTGRVSVPDDDTNNISKLFGKMGEFITPSYRTELIPLLRDLYKVNPDISIALQDMYKLANTGHYINFPNNTPEESVKMRDHLDKSSSKWLNYTAGMDGVLNKLFVQCLITGAMSFESVPKKDLSGISHIVFIKPEDITFRRNPDGTYHPYQINKYWGSDNKKDRYIKLNPTTYTYLSMYNDLDEPYGIPPFLSSLDSIKTQGDMKTNMKQIMEIMGLFGFLEVLLDKPDQLGNESIKDYTRRLERKMNQAKVNVKAGMKDGVVVGYDGDHQFKMNSTTKDLNSVNTVWGMNQQSVANGLGVAGSIIGVSNDNKTEGGTSIMFSKLIAQLKNLQMFGSFAVKKIYELDLMLSGFNCKGLEVEFYTSTVTDDIKIQQGMEYKLRNLNVLFDQGIISQQQYAEAAGYTKPDEKEPRVSRDTSVDDDGQQREKDKDTSDRKTREKSKTVPKRKDGDSKPT